MPELSTISHDTILLILLSCGTVLFALFAVMSDHQRAAVSNFLTAAILLSGIVISFGKTCIGIGMAVLYASLCSVFLLVSRMSSYRKTHAKYSAVLPPIFAGIALFLISIYKFAGYRNTGAAMISDRTELFGSILLLYLLCIVITSGIIFCSRLKKS
ncbi:MAG: hypothetical protein LBC25_00995 [Holosporales bacterium]|jgi:hypothetical protein|nr:hypothetical protein [Holosporales bacterium]